MAFAGPAIELNGGCNATANAAVKRTSINAASPWRSVPGAPWTRTGFQP
jgi:hypothetical protein